MTEVQFFINDNEVSRLDITEAECLAGAEDGWIWVEEGLTVLLVQVPARRNREV